MCFKKILPASCLRYNLYHSKPILMFNRNVAKGLCNVEMLTYLAYTTLSLRVGYSLCCYGSRRLIDTSAVMQRPVIDKAINDQWRKRLRPVRFV